MADGSALSFADAFAQARRAGKETFKWRGSEFHTRTKEEEAVKESPEPTPQDISDEAPPEAEVPEAEMGDEGSGIMAKLSEIGAALKAIVTLDEESEALPEAIKSIADDFQSALDKGREHFGSAQVPEADRFRHIVGSRNAALEHGVVPAALAGAGHEINNLVGAIKGEIDQTGLPSGAGLMQALKNSRMDMINNLIGIKSAFQNPGQLTPEQELQLAELGDLL